MKKIFALSFAVCTLFASTACNDDGQDAASVIENPSIVGGVVNDIPMLFAGTSVSVSPEGEEFTDPQASFEIVADSNGMLTLYMHGPRFAAAMPGVEMRITELAYTGRDNSISFSTAAAVPEAQITGVEGWQPFERFTITGLTGSVEGSFCRLAFGCIGYSATFEGRLVTE